MMKYDLSTISVLMTFVCKDLNKIHSVDDLIKQLSFAKSITVTESKDFYDFPYKDLTRTRDNGISNLHTIEFILGNKMKWRIMYIDSIHGAWIVLDSVNQEICGQMEFLINGVGNFIKVQDGIYKHKLADNFIRFTYYPDLDKYLITLSTSIELFDHPWYSWNKVLDTFNN